MDATPTHAKAANAVTESRDRTPNDEIGDFAEGQERTHHDQHPHRFSEGEETMPEMDEDVGDFADGQSTTHAHHIGTFAEGQLTTAP